MGDGADSGKKNWALRAGLALAALGVLAFLYAVFASLSKPEQGTYARFATGAMRALQVMEPAKPQSSRPFQTADGFEQTLANFRGQVLVVNFWATWCAPCVEEMPTLGALQRRYEGRPLRVIAISLDRPAHQAKAVAELAKLAGGSLTFYHDPTAAIAYDSGAGAGMPMTVIYGKDGRELARLAGAADWDSAEAHAVFEAALSE
jgi:thiol-disulfide isomerase/thioredoxin